MSELPSIVQSPTQQQVAAVEMTPTTTRIPNTATTQSSSSPPIATTTTISRKQAVTRFFVIVLALGASCWCWNTVARSSRNYHSLKHNIEQSWIPVQAVIVGTNRTQQGLPGNSHVNEVGDFMPYFTHHGSYYYCTIVKFTISPQDSNENKDHEEMIVTTTMDTRCTEQRNGISVGKKLEILYNPKDPSEVVEHSLFDASMKALAVAIAVSVAFALGFCGCFILLWIKRNTPLPDRRHQYRRRRPRPQQGEDVEEALALRDDEQILAQFHHQVVLEDLSNTNAKRIRALIKDDSSSSSTTTTTSTSSSSTRSNSTLNDANTDTDGSVQSRAEDTTPAPLEPLEDHQQKQQNETKSSSMEDCCICMEGYTAGESICAARNTECDHVFHQSCVINWLQHHNQCPLCRVDLMTTTSSF
eukprot:scaffold1786_cov138-Cylindrotheca_fusiformis.AAC.16